MTGAALALAGTRRTVTSTAGALERGQHAPLASQTPCHPAPASQSPVSTGLLQAPSVPQMSDVHGLPS